MADNVNDSLKDLGKLIEDADKKVKQLDSDYKQGVNGAIGLLDKVKSKLVEVNNVGLKKIINVKDIEEEAKKIPTVFDRVIEQINQRASQSKDKFAKQLIDANAVGGEAKLAITNAIRELNKFRNPLREVFQGKQENVDVNILSSAARKRFLKQQQELLQSTVITQKDNPQAYAALQRYQQSLSEIIRLQEQLDRTQRKYAANQSAIEGVSRRFNETEQAIAKVRDRWEELNVKRQAGLINEKDFKTNTQKLLDEYDRLIKKRQEFEVKDIGQMSFERERARIEEENRLAAIRRENAISRQRDEVNAERMIAQERARRARETAKADADLNSAVSKQISYQKQLNTLRKEYNTLNAKQNRTSEENAILEQTKNKIKEIIGLSKQLNNEQKGSHNLAKQITDYDRLRQKIHDANKETKEHKASLESMLPTIRRLASAFGIAFSVQGLVQFGKKLVETRGEFEMQFVAMKSIIGDVDAATKIWNQTLQQSLQSPKTFKELTRYTKQLAAYRIETEKLFDTTKRLADVSAGLGVDMGRLILAYGQVKAANYLRASEVRQFTEAGVNIYGELAKYFSEIEGRAVGTAEVVERVSKRMVLFSDVEKIFQRMTDEGGTFFNMQEIQADTVLGQINKLHDAYDQMLNTIGHANQGTIRNLLETLNDLVRNWQNVAFVLKGNVNLITLIGAALYALSRNYLKGATTQTLWFSKTIMGNSKVLLKDTADIKIFSKVIGDYSLKTRVAVVATRTLQGALSKLGNVARAIWPLVVFEGAVLLIERLTRASRELKRFREELESVTSENVGRMNEEISGYDALIKKLQKTNEGTAARKEILDEISNKYGKYLDFIVTEKTTVEELAGAYDNVVSSIRNYTAEKIREEQQQKLEKGIYDEYQDLVKSLTNKSISDAQGNQFKITKEQAKNIAKLIQQSLDKYGVVDIQSILETYFGKALGLTGAGGGNASIGNIIREYIGEYSSLNQELQNIRNDIEGQTPVFSSDAEYNDYKKRVQDANAALAEQSKKNEQIINEIKNKERAESDSWKIEDEISAQRIKNSEEELRIRKQYGLITEQQYKDAIKRLHGDLDSYETDYNTRLAKALSDQYGNTWKTSNKEARDMYNYVVSTEDALQQGTLQRNKQLVESYKGLKESLKEYKEQLSAAQKTGAGEDAVKKIQSDIDWATLMMKAIELAAQLRGLDLTDKKKGRTAHNYDSISSLISLLKEMNSEYDKLSKSAYGFAKSNEKVVESFTPAFKEIFGFAGIDISQVDTTSKRATADAMKLVIDTLDKKNLWGKFGSDGGKKARKEFVKAWSQMDVEADIDVQVRIREDFAREIEQMFSDYELTLDLQKINLPSDAAKDILGFDYTSLNSVLERVKKFRNDLENVVVGKDEEGNDIIENQFDKDDQQAYANWMKKIEDQLFNIRKERAKQYTKYLEQELSERAKLEMQYVKDVAFVEANFKGEQKDAIKQNLQTNYEQALKEFEWKSFKESDFYVEMMQDLTSMPSEYLDLMMQKLNEWAAKADILSPRALKEVLKARERVMAAQVALSPIRALGQSLGVIRDFQGSGRTDAQGNSISKNIKESREQMQGIIVAREQEILKIKEKLALEEQLAGKIKAQEELQESLNQLTNKGVKGLQMTADAAQDLANIERASSYYGVRLSGLLAGGGVEQAEGENDADFQTRKGQYEDEVRELRAIIALLNQLRERRVAASTAGVDPTQDYSAAKMASIKRITDLRKQLTEEERKQAKDQGIMTTGYAAWNNAVHGLAGNIKEVTSKAKEMGNQLYETFEVLGVETDVVDEAVKDFGNSLVDVILQAIEMIPSLVTGFTAAGVAINAAMGIIGLIALAIQAVLSLISGLAKIHDAKLERDIQNYQERIDDLTRAYERLEKQIEKTWESTAYIRTNAELVENLNEQIRALESQRNAEMSKKKSDEDKIKDYTNSIQEAEDNLEELQRKQIEVFGGIGEDSYRSAAEGFVDAWKQAFLETGDGLQALQDHFDEFLQDWFVKQATMRIAGKMLESTFNKIDAAVNEDSEGGVAVTAQELAAIRDKFAAVAPELSDALEQLAGMWDLQGEGGLSGLAAGIQGMTEEQANILEAYWNSVRMYTASIDMNVARIADVLGAGGAESNPMLQQMSLIAANVQATHQLLESVTKSGHSQGGYGIKVFND